MDATAFWSGSSNTSSDSDNTDIPESKQDIPEKKGISQVVHLLHNPVIV